MRIETLWRPEDGGELPALVWRPGPRRMISSGLLGGGIGAAGWVLNAQVPGAYARMDPLEHLRELAARFGLEGPGVGLLTAAEVRSYRQGGDGGVAATATVGLRVPTWAASPEGRPDPELAPAVPERFRPGTINIVVSVPVALEDAALVNAVLTATEAKTQALLEAGYDCSGTASDAVCVAASDRGAPEPFAGPRSVWGARIARAVHAAVLAGAHDYTRRWSVGGAAAASVRKSSRSGLESGPRGSRRSQECLQVEERHDHRPGPALRGGRGPGALRRPPDQIPDGGLPRPGEGAALAGAPAEPHAGEHGQAAGR